MAREARVERLPMRSRFRREISETTKGSHEL